MSGGNGSMNNHNIYQQYWDSNHGDVSSGINFINSHTISQYNDSRTFKDMDGDIENDDVSTGYGYMNSHNVYQNNGFKSLMNYNDRGDNEMHTNVQNGDVSSGYGYMNSHNLSQYKESSKLNDTN